MSQRSVSSFSILRPFRSGRTCDRSSVVDVRHGGWSGFSSGIERSRRRPSGPRRIRACSAHDSGRKTGGTTAVSQYNPGSITAKGRFNRRLEVLPDRSNDFRSDGAGRSSGAVKPSSGGSKRAIRGHSGAVSGRRAHAPDRPGARHGLSGLPRDLDLGDAAAPALTLGAESTKTGGYRDPGGLLVTRSERSSLRQTSIVLLLGCAALGLSAPAFAQGPAPEPAPPATRTPRPEPVPRTTRPEPPQQTNTTPARTTQPSPPPPPASPPSSSPSPPPAQAQTPVFVQPQSTPTPSPPVRRPPARVQKPPVAKKTPKRSTQPSRRALPRARAVAESASPDTMLLAGGLALFVLVLGDTVFLTLSARFLRQT